MTALSIDFETRSDVDLKTRGSGPYFASPHFKALMACYQIDDGPISDWLFYQPCPDDLREAVEAGCIIRAFNASFERQCFEQLHEREGWPLPDISQYHCTAAQAAAMALPRSLEALGDALALDCKKDKGGKDLIRHFSLPRRARKGEDPNTVHWNEPADFPEKFQEFLSYCRRDVETEAAAYKRLMPLSDYEQAVYTHDQEINKRGIRIDVESALAAIALADKATAGLDEEMRIVTGGFVNACSNVSKLVEWINGQGVELSSATKAELSELLNYDDIPPQVRTAVELRQEAGKVSVKKLIAMVARADADDRVRNSFMIYGADTGRWTNLGVNFANMPRPRKLYEKAKLDTHLLFDTFRKKEPGLLKLQYGDELGRPLHLVSDAIRGFVWAAPGHELIQADYSGIEGAVIAWSSGEQWKVDALFEIMTDPDNIPDLYRRAAAGIMGMTTDEITKDHPLRQSVGKVSELALGFAGGVAAFESMSRNYGVKLDPLYLPVWEAASEEAQAKAVKRYESCLKRKQAKTDVLSREAWIACEIIKNGWRATNPAISAGWKLREDAVRDAVGNPGQVISTLKFKYVVKQGFLWCMLPSGRCLAYGSPKLKDQVWAKVLCDDGSWSDAEVMDRDVAEAGELKGAIKIEGSTSQKVTALGVDQTGRKLERFALYGGLLAENDTQAVARDLMVNGQFKARDAGYPVIAHVYDEIICEVPNGFGSVKAFEELICELPWWAEGLPLSASGWRGKRYRKD